MRIAGWKMAVWTTALSCILCVAIILAGPAAAQTLAPETARQRALDLVNQSRRAHQLPPLTLETKLNEAAQGHAADMAKRNYYAHNSPEGKSVGDRFQKVGGSRWLLTAENIAKCADCRPPLSDDVLLRLQEGWMNSPGHRANILHKGLATFGFGIVLDARGGLYAVQNFAGPGGSDESGAADAGKPLSPEEQGRLALEAVNRERKKLGRAALKLSGALNTAARTLVPVKSVDAFGLEKGLDVFALLPDAEQKSWAEITVLAGICGGCGVQPAAPDVARFTAQWLGDAGSKTKLLDPALTHIGFTVAASGGGKKVGVGLLGKRR